ncbi:Serine protease family s10, partial [Globisporangium splendens]
MKVFRNLVVLAALALSGVMAATDKNAADRVTNLPGLDVDVGFKHYAGHVQLATQEQLFYWYTESQQSPEDDPIVLWLNGGPGCSAMGGFFTENGPFVVEQDLSLKVNRHSWNRKVNLVWVESPAGVGFSGPLQDASYYNDDIVAARAYEFLAKFFDKYSELKDRKFYITGESYAGIYIPYLVNLLVEKPIPGVNLQGFAIGNPFTDSEIDGGAYIDYYYSHGLISLENYREMYKQCGHDIGCVNMDGQCSPECQAVLEEGILTIQEDQFNPYFIYGDKCLLTNNQADALRFKNKTKGATTNSARLDIGPCAETFTQEYLNQPEVQRAIHVPEQVAWTDCNDAVSDVFTRSNSSLSKYQNILAKGKNLTGLIYSGDADSVVNFIGTERWLGEDGLKLHVTNKWRAWFGPDKQLAGYVQDYEGLTFKTIKGAGHMVPAVKPLHGLNMFECFVFGDEQCAAFTYPWDEDEIESGAFMEFSVRAKKSSWVGVWVPVAVVASAAAAAFVVVRAKNSKKRSSYEPIGSTV